MLPFEVSVSLKRAIVPPTATAATAAITERLITIFLFILFSFLLLRQNMYFDGKVSNVQQFNDLE
jgi:hypothetical protein